jgi:hypothetical protein
MAERLALLPVVKNLKKTVRRGRRLPLRLKAKMYDKNGKKKV